MTPLARRHRDTALGHISRAISNLSDAAQAACPLRGWSEEWHDIGAAHDQIKALWHRIDSAPYPINHDREPRPTE